jgi:predicted nucleotidyltransferase
MLDDKEDNTELLNFLHGFEKEYDIRLIFVCESASRAYGVEVDDSDYDLKGLYLPNPKDSLKIKRKIEPTYKIPHFKIIKNSVEYDVDVEFIDFREFALMKNQSVYYFDFFMFSPTVYINIFPEVIETIKSNLKPMPNEFLFRFRKMMECCEKVYEKSGECMNKKLLGALIHAVQYIHAYFYKSFPLFNIFEQIKFLKDKIQNNELDLEKSDLNLLQEMFDLIQYYYEEKKKGRKSISNTISDNLSKFRDLLEKFYDEDKKEKKTVYKYTLDLSLFQELLDKMLTNNLF